MISYHLKDLIQHDQIQQCFNCENINPKWLSESMNVEICTDSRVYECGQVFFGLVGEKFDARTYFNELYQKGCRVFMTQDDFEFDKKLVDDTQVLLLTCRDQIEGLHALTRYFSDTFIQGGGKILAISGSNGKTTTKEMVYELLSEKGYSCIKTQSNNNNLIGVPLSIFQLRKHHKFAIIELGSNHPGEIPSLSKALMPNFVYCTNIGHTHLEFFKDIEEVYKEESSIYEFSRSHSFALINSDDIYLQRRISDSKSNGSNKKLEIVSSENLKAYQDKLDIILNNKMIREVQNSSLLGKHNYWNLGVSILLCSALTESSVEDFLGPAKKFKPRLGRSELRKNHLGQEIFYDAYNANPSSTKLALETFREYLTHNQKGQHEKAIVFVGEMKELGPSAEKHHRELANFLKDEPWLHIIYVGAHSEYFKNTLARRVQCFHSTQECLDFLKENLSWYHQFSYLFFKASRSLQFESLVDIK